MLKLYSRVIGVNEFEMPKLKVKLSKFEVEELRRRKKTKSLLIVFLLLTTSIIGGLIFYLTSYHKEVKIVLNETSIDSVEILSYKKEDNIINLSIKPSNDQEYCSFSLEAIR